MTSRRLLLGLAISLVSLSALAQLPGLGQSFALQSVSTSRYLGASSAPGAAETLVLSEAIGVAERWHLVQVDGYYRVIESSQGTVLSVLTQSGVPVHTVFFGPFSSDCAELWNLDLSAANGTAPDEAVLFYTGGYDYVLTVANGVLGMSSTGGRVHLLMSPVPPAQKWKIIPLPASTPAALKRGIPEGQAVRMQAFDKTFLMQNTPLTTAGSLVTQFNVEHLANGTSGYSMPQFYLRRSSQVVAAACTTAVRFGEWTHLWWKLSGTEYYFLKQSALMNPGNLPRAISVYADASQWILVDPSGRYKTGDRVPRETPFLLMEATTKLYLGVSVDPAVLYPQLTAAAGERERWVIP